MFIHSVQNVITIGAFTESLDDFLLDEPAYVLPAGALWRLYVPGEKHLIGYGWTQRDGDIPWVEGDVYLAREIDYQTMHPDTSPDVPGFEAALVAAFGGDYLAINSLYSGWPLFKDALESAQWEVADLLLTDSYVRYEITTETYTLIVEAARAHYIPMALQGRPGLMPINIIDEARVTVLPPSNWLDSATIGCSDVSVITPLNPIQGTDSSLMDCTESVRPVVADNPQNDELSVGLSEATPSLVIS